MSGVFTRRRILIGLAVLLVLFVAPPFIRLNKYSKGKIVEALRDAVGRPVSVKNVGLQLLPRPGLVLEDFLVQEDPAFGAEPVLRAREVTAIPRLSSLWRARLEIGTLQLQEPSLNLVRTQEGRWNIEALLNRATHTAAAPTTKNRPEARLRFPYIEAKAGRINFKSGPEKMVWAFSDADFALWLESEDLWNMRLQARPVRTDANLSDTGTVQISGYFRRTEYLRETPLNLRLVLERAQLGQLTRLIQGRDRGWRGALYVNATLAGTPSSLNVSGDLSVDEFRRYDIFSNDGFRLSAHCQAVYQLSMHGLSGIDCRVPERDGQFTLRGSVGNILTDRTYDLAITSERVPVSELLRFLRHAKRGLPEDLNAAGVVNSELAVSKPHAGDPPVWAGKGAAEDVTLQAHALTQPVLIERIAFAHSDLVPTSSGVFVTAGAAASAASAKSGNKTRIGSRNNLKTPARPAGWHVGPFFVPLGAASPLVVEANLSHDGYSAQVKGEPDLGRLLALVRSIGGRAPQLTAKGLAAVDIAISGKWSGFAAPDSSGTLQLRNVNLGIRGINAPLHVSNAQVAISPAQVRVSGISAGFGSNRSRWQGTAEYPRSCSAGVVCPIRIELHADELSTDELNRLFNPRAGRKWYQFLSADTSALSGIAMNGRITADRVAIKSVTARQVAAQLNLDSGKLRLSDFRAEVFGGLMHGEWQANLASDPPVYSGTGQLDRAGMAHIAQIMHDDFATGTVSATYKVSLAGWSEPELLASAAGTLEFAWAEGTLRSAALDSSGSALQISILTAQGEWRNGRLELSAGRMETPGGIYQITGTAGPQLDLRLRSGNRRAYVLSGTPEQPRVTMLPVSETQASLKP